MAVYNGRAYVEEAIESILRQTFTQFEFLIIDDASTDDTTQRIDRFRDPRIRLIRNETNLGLTRSLNRGLAVARGALIARQDADDVSHESRLAAQVGFLEQQPNVVVVGAQCRYVDSRGRPRNVAPWPKSTSTMAIRWQLLFDGPFIHTSVMFRRAVIWDELGGYDESFVTSQDFELWSRVASHGFEMRNLDAKLVDFRVHDGSVSTRYRLESAAKLRAVFLGTLVAQLGTDAVPPGWPDTLIRITNPNLFPESDDAPTAVTRAISRIHKRFVEVNPPAANDQEIRRHMAAMLIRLANASADRRWFGSIVPFAKGCRLDPSMGVRAAPRYLAHLTLGMWRRLGAATGRGRPAHL
jgi:glycosyltransferase involved in cell wall biosynthesis